MSFKESDVQNQVSFPQTGSNNGILPISQVVVFTDIDDTCYPTKSKPFYTRAKSGVFPGMSEFLLALSRGAHNHKPRPINVVSARAGNTLQFLRIGKNSKISKSLQKAGGSLGDVLYGKFGDQTTFIRGSWARRVALAERKARNISRYMRALTKYSKQIEGKVGGSEVSFTGPASEDDWKDGCLNKFQYLGQTFGGKQKLQAIFCGDNGEGDYLAAEYMINNFPDMKAVFIHKVELSSKENHKNELWRKDELRRLTSVTQLNPRQNDRPKLLLYDTVAEASMMAYRHGLVSLSSLHTIYDAIVKSDLYKQHDPRRKNLSLRSDEPSQHKKCVAKTPGGQWVAIEKAQDREERVACIPVEKLVCLPHELVRYRVSSVEKRKAKERRGRVSWTQGGKLSLDKSEPHVKYNFEDRHKKQFFDHAWQLKRMVRDLEMQKIRAKRVNKRLSRSLSPPPASRRRRIGKEVKNPVLCQSFGEEREGLEDGVNPPDVLIGGDQQLSMPELEYPTSVEHTPPRPSKSDSEGMIDMWYDKVELDPWRLTVPARFTQREEIRRKSDPLGLNPKFLEEPSENSLEALGMIRRTIEFLKLSSNPVGQASQEQRDCIDYKSPQLSLSTKKSRSLAFKL